MADCIFKCIFTRVHGNASILIVPKGPTVNKSELDQVLPGKGLARNRQQAITLVNVDPDLCHHMASLGHTELILKCH